MSISPGTQADGKIAGRSRDDAKRCQTCGTQKPLIAFPPHRGSKDGRRVHCRECLTSGLYRPEPETPTDRQRRAKRQGSAFWMRSHRLAVGRYGKRHPHEAAAKRALQEAVAAGRVQKAQRCQVAKCSSRKAIEGHHWSYAPEHQLEVLWCCAAHHRQGHARGFIVPAAGVPAHYGTVPGMATDTEFRASTRSTHPKEERNSSHD